LLHQLFFHIHTHTFHSTDHIFGDICPFGPIKKHFLCLYDIFQGKKRIEVNGLIVFELQLVLLQQLIFLLHTHTIHSTEHIFGNICPFGPIKTVFSPSSPQLSGERGIEVLKLAFNGKLCSLSEQL
jgi:hypothetical protein